MTFPYTMWVPVIPEGGHCPFLMRETRKEAIATFNAWHPDFKWKTAQRKGWRMVKMYCYPNRREET